MNISRSVACGLLWLIPSAPTARPTHCVRCSCDSAIQSHSVGCAAIRSECSRPFAPQGVVAFGRMLHELATGAELDGPTLALDANLRCAPQIASIIKLIFKVTGIDLSCVRRTHAFTHAHALMHARTHALIHTRALRNTHIHARSRRCCTNASRGCAAGFGLCQSSLLLAANRLLFRIPER